MRESRPYGSERGAFSNGRPYRDRTSGLRSVGTRAFDSAAASGSAALSVQGTPMDSALDRRWFTCPAQRKRREGPDGLDENRRVACRRFIAAAHDHIDLERLELDPTTDAGGLVGGDEVEPEPRMGR
jgi:hypothetical protein